MSRKALIWEPLILVSLIFLTGCIATLAPQYDKAVMDGLTISNAEVMGFFASVSGGTKKDSFDQRKEKYTNIVGRFDALEIQAKARPIPKNKITDIVLRFWFVLA
ncbi:MAG: hypothetical protein GY795_02010 [Desulfobacterales bacterium]|nr:hypothetical protein [Desulfobacterales bacterium]